MHEQHENAAENAYVQQGRSRAMETKRRGTKRTAVATQEQWQDQSRTFLGGAAHPWRRFFARALDYFIPGILLVVVLFLLFGAPTSEQLAAFEQGRQAGGQSPLVGSIILCLVWMPIEAFFLSLFGATPAKWLFGIRVAHPDGTLLRYGEALKRSFLVFVQGEGCAIPLIGIFTYLFSYRHLTKTGTTRWDTTTNAVVTHTQWGVGRALACIVCSIIALLVLGVGGAQGG